jgi:hypothetical protein
VQGLAGAGMQEVKMYGRVGDQLQAAAHQILAPEKSYNRGEMHLRNMVQCILIMLAKNTSNSISPVLVESFLCR